MTTESLDISGSPSPVSVFISYARKDEVLKNRLLKHVSMLKHQGLIAAWHDEMIPPGATWSSEIGSKLESAQIILLLISPDFLASKYCYDVEMKRAIERHELDQACVIPIFLRPCDWQGAPFGKLQGLPKNAEPVTGSRWSNQDEAFKSVAEGLRAAIERFSRGQNPTQAKLAEIAIPIKKLSALHQLPPPPADFTGRTDEISELIEAIRKNQSRIICIFGMGGLGKTALALKVADQIRDDFPDGQIYLDLKGISAEPSQPRDVMAHVIRSFDYTARLPETDTEITSLYRSVLYGKKVLLLLDNAANEKQVDPLIPPASCLLLLTSRLHFKVPGLIEKTPDILSAKDAETLLHRVAPRLAQAEKEQVAHLARLCGYLPLALRTAASALHIKRYLKPSTYLARLENTSTLFRELSPVDLALRLTFELLSERMQQKFRLLAVFPDTFDTSAAAALWQAERGVVEESLEKLLVYSLVEFSEKTERFRLHDLVRLFADVLLTASERLTAERRHSGHYLKVLTSAESLYAKGGDWIARGLALFDAEWANIRVGQMWARAHAENDRVAAEWCAQYATCSPECLVLRRYAQERVTWLESAVKAARIFGHRAAELAALSNLAIAYGELGQPRRAIEIHTQLLDIARKSRLREAEATSLGNLANEYTNVGEQRRAIELYEQCILLHRELHNRGREGFTLGNLGLAYFFIGEYRRASEYYEQAILVHREEGDLRGEGMVLGNVGMTYERLGDYERAIQCHEQQLRIARAMNDRRGEMNALGNLGNAYKGTDEYNRALQYHDQALQIAREIGSPFAEAAALSGIATALALWGNRLEAIRHAEDALRIFEEIGSPYSSTVRDQVAKWREEEKAKGQAAE